MPRTFQISLAKKCFNLYEAFFSTNHLNLSLLLYKPEIENVYIKPIGIEPKQLEVILSKREKLGLVEAINLNLLNLKNLSSVDAELVDLLNTSIGIKKLTILDCLNDSSLILDKYLFNKLHLDSPACRSLLGEDRIKKIKKLITRINIKSYIISLNSSNNSQLINFKTPNVVYNKPKTNLIKETKSFILEFVCTKDTNGNLIKYSIAEAKKLGILNVQKGVYLDKRNNLTLSLEEAIDLGLIGARVAVCEKNLLDQEHKQISESSTLTIESVINAKTRVKHSIAEAIRMGILDNTNLSYKNTQTGKVMPLNEAYELGFIKGNLYPVKKRVLNKQNASKCILNKNSDGKTSLVELEENSWKIKSILNPKSKKYLSIEQASVEGIFDKTKGVYIEPLSGTEMSLNEALVCGYIQVEKMDNLNSILVIDIKNKDQKNVHSFYKEPSVLYEVRECEKLKEQRIERILDEEEEEEYESLKRNLKPKILERRIPSFYESNTQLFAETLIIDDVRQSTMLDIDGEMHVSKNECLIEDESISNSSSSMSKQANRTVIIVDDKLIESDEFLTNSERAQFERQTPTKTRKNNLMLVVSY